MSNKQLFQQVQILFYAIMSGHILFACIVVFAIKPLPTDTLNTDVVLGIVVTVSILIILLGFWLYAKQLKDLVSRNQNPEDRLLAWRIPFIVRIAMIDAVCLLNLVMLLVSGSSIFLYIYIAAAAIMMYTKPQPWKIADELSLDKLWD